MVRDPLIVKTTDTSVKLGWTAETYASQYQIRVKNIKVNTTEQAPLIPVKQVINGTTQFSTTYEIDLLRQATQYSIQIVAFDEKGRPGIPVPVSGEKPLIFTTNPAPVSSLSVNETFTRDGFLLVNWRPAFGAEYFELMVFDSQAALIIKLKSKVQTPFKLYFIGKDLLLKPQRSLDQYSKSGRSDYN